jgi:hypothetical protein
VTGARHGTDLRKEAEGPARDGSPHNGSEALAGNGALLVRELALAARIQGALERLYGLDRVADVADFAVGTEPGDREALLLREADDGAIELRVLLPCVGAESANGGLDTLCQIIEGVSHFVYVVERARVQREATHLELEMQAEVDKWVVLAASMHAFDATGSALLRARLYERVRFSHDETTELGQRYRIANEAAHRFVRRLERRYVSAARFSELRCELRQFFHLGQEEKLRLGHAA